MNANLAATSMTTGQRAIPLDRSNALFRWNAVLSLLHLLQALAILALSFAKNPVVASPVVGTYLRFDEATRHLVTA